MFPLKHIARIVNAKLSGPQDREIVSFFSDSRSLQLPESSLFIALSTGRNDGHRYIEELIQKGVKAFLIKNSAFDVSKHPQVSFLEVADPLAAVQTLAAAHRQQFKLPVIAITGSNGKTVVKEWLYQLLKDRYSICRSPKSYNSQLGVPLSVLNLSDQHQLAIFEAGISKPNEMERLEKIIQPTIGIFTSIGSAHDEGFKSRDEKVLEKFKLFVNCQHIIVNGLKLEEIPEDYRAKCVLVENDLGLLSQLESGDEASLRNACTCMTLMRLLGYKDQEILSKVKNLQHIALRLEMKNGIHNSLLINDFYNSDLDSLKIAMSYLKQQHRRQKKVMLISDIEQSGMPSQSLYRQLSELVNAAGLDLLVGIGSEIGKYRSLFKASSLFYESTADFLAQFRSIDFQLGDATILLKGARSFGFESISRLLQQKSHDTVFEVDLNRLTENVNYYRSLTGPAVKMMCMVKAMGYGSGSADIARTLQHMGVNYLAVAYADEGVELRQSNIGLPVMVMNPEEEALEDLVNFNLEPEIYNFRMLELFAKKLEALGITEPYPVHIKIDTGMKRLGFEEKDFEALAKKLSGTPALLVRSVFSHLAASDNPAHDEFTLAQMKSFEKACAIISQNIAYPFLRHICNSGGITRFPQAHYDMVRLGIGMYGIGVSETEQKELKNVGTLKSRISQLKTVGPDETIGYNRNGKVQTQSNIAIVPIGYADGFSRLLGNGRHGVYINGKFCKTLGNICMDMCMVDVTDVKCKEGDEVIIFENAEQINALATALGSIPYEVLTNVSGRVKRVYVQE